MGLFRLFLTSVFYLIVSGCVNSPAPGCRFNLMPGPTGCFGKTAITNLSKTPVSDCLSVLINNCRGGELRIDNACQVDFVIAGKHVAVNQSAVIEASQLSKGESQMITGMLGTEMINIKYSKRRYCN